jgi:hypothetical protein
MALPTQNDVRPVDPVLTNLSIGFKNKDYIWDQVAPSSVTDQKSGTFFRYTRDYWFRTFGEAGGAKRAPASTYKRVGYGVETDTYETIEYGFEKPDDDATVAASQTPESLPQVTTAYLTDLINREIEMLVAAAAFVTGVWGTSNTLAGTDQWSDLANSDPIADSETARLTVRRNTGAEPNLLVVGAATWNDLKEHPLLLDKYKHTQTGILTEDLVAAALGIDRLVVGKSVKNTANEGATFSGSDIWTDNALFLVQNSPGLMVANGASTFVWTEAGKISGNPPWAIQSYREEQTRSEVQRAFTHVAPKVISSQHGYLHLDTAA